ncbi:MAG TPA: GDSL-type esterase/lipase family protein [Solirubrobacteraceae bacterium]|nr:GDSL-type esterase/lipase family protein [Solirubrobacteraceae bacterium]
MDCRLGVLAFGDSITNGGGELQWGVALQSWALWTARGLGLPFTTYAVDGARAADVAGAQLAAFAASAARADARYDVGCLYAGVNDVRAPDWDPGAFERDLRTALAFLAARCDRTLACTIPLDLGRPRAGARVPEANAAIRRASTDHGALVVALEDFGARNRVMVDAVHPTAFGQIELAERALRVLAADGLPPRVRPSTLIAYETTPWRRLRGDATYVYRQAKQAARIAAAGARIRRRAG